MLRSIRANFRSLKTQPAFLVTTTLLLSLGIGANLAIFLLVRSVFIDGLPGVKHADHLVVVVPTSQSGEVSGFSYPLYLRARDSLTAFDGLIGYDMRPFTVSGESNSGRIWGMLATDNYFEVLGVPMIQGRSFATQTEPGNSETNVAVLSFQFWRSYFLSKPDVVGTSMKLNGIPFTIIGIASPYFEGTLSGLRMDVWIPMSSQPQVEANVNRLTRRDAHWFSVMGRLGQRASLAQANDALEAFFRRSVDEGMITDPSGRILALPLWKSPIGTQAIMGPTLLVLSCIVFLILVTACGNIAILSYSRHLKTRREIALRFALGATRRDLVMDHLVQALMIAALGGFGALFIAVAGGTLLMKSLPAVDFPISLRLGWSPLLFIVCTGTSIIAGLLLGLSPIFYLSQTTDHEVLRQEQGQTGITRSRLRIMKGLMALQVMIAVILLICAATFLRSASVLRHTDLSFDTASVATASFDLGSAQYSKQQGVLAYNRLLSSLQQSPELGAVALSRTLPLSLGGDKAVLKLISGNGIDPAHAGQTVGANIVSPGFFNTVGLSLISGRDFDLHDTSDHPAVAIVNETFARTYLAGRDPLGATLMTPSGTVTVVGIAKNSKYVSLSELPRPYAYLPLAQNYDPTCTIVARARGSNIQSTLVAIRGKLEEIDPSLPIFGLGTLSDTVKSSLMPQRLAAMALSVCSLLALLISGTGIYGLLLYIHAQRLRDYAIRVTLGASKAHIALSICKEAFHTIVMGSVLGTLVAIGIIQVIRGFLPEISTVSAAMVGAVLAIVAPLVILATFIPARLRLLDNPAASLNSH